MEKNKKILIVSNNSLSIRKNNGKTINSIFQSYPNSLIRQLYFNTEIPDGKSINSFFRITDKEILQKKFRVKYNAGRIVKHKNGYKNKIGEKNDLKISIPRNSFTRLVRELIWHNNWQSTSLLAWLDDFEPDLIFFVAGDSIFAYDIVNFIQNRYQTKLITYITDDYILKRRTLSPSWWIKRNKLLQKIKRILSKTDVFLTISHEMKNVYLDIFNKDSQVVVNMANRDYYGSEENTLEKTITITYAGGLHLNRDKVIYKCGEAIKNINKGESNIIQLEIYSSQNLDKRSLGLINTEGASKYMGSLDSTELHEKLKKSDILLHVESFQNKNIEDTRLSISTKISEYASYGKIILAIGPNQVASMKLLKDYAYCINNIDEIESKLHNLLSNPSLQNHYRKQSKLLFDKISKENKNSTIENLIQQIYSD